MSIAGGALAGDRLPGGPVPPRALPELWRARAAALRRYAEPVARALEDCAAELDAAAAAQDGELLSLTDAAAVCGFSPDHLGRLVRRGAIANSGRAHRPLIRRGDLPRRAVARRGPVAYDANADARELLATRRGAS